MALLTFIILYSIMAIDDSTRIKERVTAEDREITQAQGAMERLSLDLGQIFSPLYYEPLEKTPTTESSSFEPSLNYPEISEGQVPIPAIKNPDKSTLAFLTSANRRRIKNAKRSQYAWIRYSIRETSLKEEERRQGGDFDLIRQFSSSHPYAKELDWEKVKEQLLLRHVKEMEFSFWSEARKEFVSSLEEIRGDRDENENLIRALKLKLTWINANGNESSIARSFRPLWPFFSAQKEKRELEREAGRR